MKHLSMRALISRLSKLCAGQVIDIVIFGSAVKGKEEPRDIDIAVLLKNEDYILFDSLVKQIRKISALKMQFELLPIDKILKEPLFLTLLHEGVSCKNKKPFAEMLKTKSIMLVTYTLGNLNKSQKTLFGYALRGRTNSKGVLDKLGGETVGRSGFIIPVNNFEKIKELLNCWDVKFAVRRLIFLPSYVR